MQIEKNIAATLQRKMKAAGKTKLEFSRELGIPRSTFQEYLKGDKCLRSDSIEELAKSLEISPAQLISGPDYAESCGMFSIDALLAEVQTLHPRAQGLAQEAVSLLQTAFRLSAEWDRLDALSDSPVCQTRKALTDMCSMRRTAQRGCSTPTAFWASSILTAAGRRSRSPRPFPTTGQASRVFPSSAPISSSSPSTSLM